MATNGDQIPQAEMEKTQYCGFGLYRPKCLQRFRSTRWVLFWLCCAAAVQGMVVNGLLNVVISSIERRYGLRSSQSGLIAGGYDIASFLCLVPVSYFGGQERCSKPLWLGIGVLLIGIGSLIFAVPQPIVGAYLAGQPQNYICHIENSTMLDSCPSDQHLSNDLQRLHQSLVMWIFMISQLIIGVGAAPLYTMGVVYLDENVTMKMSPIYLSIYYTASVIGPALGFWLGAETLKYYTDFPTNDPVNLGLTSDSRVWVGAWWLGFVLAGAICFILVLPILALPRSLPGSEAIRREKESEVHESSQFESFQRLHEIPLAFRQLIVNPAYTFLSLAGACESFLITGFLSFMPKVIENEYGISASLSSILMGVFTVPAAGGGLILGGYLVKKWDLNCKGIQKLCLYCAGISLILTSCFLLYCPTPKFAGLNTPYSGSYQGISMTAPCNANCFCHLSEWAPVCGVDGVNYYSPCHAGCKNEYSLESRKAFSNCTCIKRLLVDNSHPRRSWSDATLYDAENVYCDSDCGYLWPFIGLAFLLNLSTFVAAMPALSATLRYVRVEQRTFALGIQWLIVRLFGTIPGPMVFGAIIDGACILWEKDECGNVGSCRVYDNSYMGRYLLAISAFGKLCSLFLFTCTWWLYIPPAAG